VQAGIQRRERASERERERERERDVSHEFITDILDVQSDKYFDI
jgi:hypothetical protein